MKGGIIMSKKLLNFAFLVEILAGVLLFISTREIIISLLLVISGFLFIVAGNLFNSKEN